MSQPPQAAHGRRIGSGIANLDDMLDGGFLASSATMLLGYSGSGKTMLALHFLAQGAAQEEKVLYFGYYESPERMIECAESSGIGCASA